MAKVENPLQSSTSSRLNFANFTCLCHVEVNPGIDVVTEISGYQDFVRSDAACWSSRRLGHTRRTLTVMSASPPKQDAFPADITVSRATAPDSFHPEPVPAVSQVEIPSATVEAEHEVNDYTGGASPMDIASVLRERSAQEAENTDSPLGQGDDEAESE